ncbi:phosphate acyltransferase PlsX [Wolbachia endosymbiont of Pentidionis agamae]|uniref:phosphate acyltransferase PlsX n=1 Tax=Wolbachia endosymbiont of Pentidionis agamae TaxID=3110435 RepID=UPI002FD68282
MSSATDNIVIALDAMGGDFAPQSVIHGADFFYNNLLNCDQKVFFHIYGDQSKVLPLLVQCSQLKNNFKFINCSDNVLANDRPSFALRYRKGSSMKAAIDSVKSGKTSGVVSAGNTGALMAISRFTLGTLSNIYRPAIISMCPTKSKNFVLLDLGANVDCSANILFQFALMGSIFAKIVLKVENPQVALLNIGSEEIKGTDSVRKAFKLLKDASNMINFKGYIEASEFLDGMVDVIVADGFVGNVMLKTAEATASTIIDIVKKELSNSLVTKFLSLLLKTRLNKALSRFNPKIRNGAIFLGLNGIVVKSHGNSDSIAFAHAIKFAVDIIHSDLNDKIINGVSNIE